MNTKHNQSAKSYRLSFLINGGIGVLMLFLSAVGYILENVYPDLRGGLAWGFMWPAVICLFIAALHHARYLSLSK
jgi:hypothetical protein